MWKKCSSCRKPIDFGETYFQCSVSTCQRAKTSLLFCSVGCWAAHLATAHHREAWAEEARAPSRAAWDAEQNREPATKSASSTSAPRKVVATGSASSRSTDVPKDILIVVSKLKKYIKESSGMKTSDGCAAMLSDYVRKLCDRAVQNAAEAERKTVLDRDFRGLM